MAKKEGPTHDERTVTIGQATLRDAIAGSLGLVDTVTAFLTAGACHGISKTDNRQESILQNVVNKTIGERLRSLDFKNHFLRRSEDLIW